jgi:hypothetical protein
MLDKLTNDISAPSGWAVFNHIKRPHAALVTKDPISHLLKGVRYQVTPQDIEGALYQKKYIFSIEGWCYPARGPIRHHTLLSFELMERNYPDPRLSHYVSKLRMFNRPLAAEDRKCSSAIRYAAEAIRNIDQGIYFDWMNNLERFGLLDDQLLKSMQLCCNALSVGTYDREDMRVKA